MQIPESNKFMFEFNSSKGGKDDINKDKDKEDINEVELTRPS